jgi:hypothetical protein
MNDGGVIGTDLVDQDEKIHHSGEQRQITKAMHVHHIHSKFQVSNTSGSGEKGGFRIRNVATVAIEPSSRGFVEVMSAMRGMIDSRQSPPNLRVNSSRSSSE